MKKDKSPTLADQIIREFFKPSYARMGDSGWLIRNMIDARKFVLDDSMSAFMADLAYASLVAASDPVMVLDGMRTLARLPHKITWIEFNHHARAARANSEYGANLNIRGEDEAPLRCGWLCIQHPQLETAFMVFEMASNSYVKDDDGKIIQYPNPALFPLGYAWRTDDGPPPWPFVDIDFKIQFARDGTNRKGLPSQVLTGIAQYENTNIGLVVPPFFRRETAISLINNSTWNPMAEIASDLRYTWALLATINDLPTIVQEIKPDKGYVARGRYRKFVEHKVISLTVPAKVYRTIAKKAISISRKRAHMVRGHWRKNYRRPGERIWIHEHQRGDASLGFVTHDYTVERSKEGEPR